MNPEYLKDVEAKGEVDFGKRGLELTRRARAAKLWLTFRAYGSGRIRDAVRRGVDLAEFAEAVLRRPARWPRPLDVAAAGREGGRARTRRVGFPRGGAAGAQKNELKPWRKKCWVIPPYASGEFACRMEEVLELYKLPYDPRFPLVRLDET